MSAQAAPTRVEEIRARLEKVTPGPWKVRAPNGRPGVWTSEGCKVASVEAPDVIPPFAQWKRQDNAALIAHAPEDLAWLLEHLAAAEERAERLRLALDKAMSWGQPRYLPSDEYQELVSLLRMDAGGTE